MSGHSKWAKIKRQKGVNDAKRGALFTKLGKNIALAAKEGGADPAMNFALRLAVDKAKAANMPSNNIERAIAKGSGKDSAQDSIQRVSYEALGPFGSSLIIDVQTDNTNRTVSELRGILEKAGGKMASINSLAWKFAEQGLIIVKPAYKKHSEKYGQDDYYEDADIEEVELALIEIPGISDLKTGTSEGDEGEEYNVIEIFTNKSNFAEVLKRIEALGLKIENAELIKVPNDILNIDQVSSEKLENFLVELEEHEDVDSVWCDVNLGK